MKPGVLVVAVVAWLLQSPSADAAEPIIWYALADRLEYQEQPEEWLWDFQGWIGGDERKLWWKTEGHASSDEFEEAEIQLLYGKAMSPFFDLQFGIRHDIDPDPSRTFAVIGIQGLAPQWFEIDAAAFLSDEGDLSARFEAEYDLLLTQRLVLQPRFEVNLGASDVPELGLGSGIRETDLGFRLRYEIRREFAPYAGISWRKAWGGTADILETSGADDDLVTIVVGARFWF